MESQQHLFKELELENLLPIQRLLLERVLKKPFNMAQKTTYEPLLELYESLFVIEHPQYDYCRRIGELFFEHDVTSIHSNYIYFQHEALWYLHYIGNQDVQDRVSEKLIQNSDPALRAKRIQRILTEQHVKTAWEK